jgi:hypothetical protein
LVKKKLIASVVMFANIVDVGRGLNPVVVVVNVVDGGRN